MAEPVQINTAMHACDSLEDDSQTPRRWIKLCLDRPGSLRHRPAKLALGPSSLGIATDRCRSTLRGWIICEAFCRTESFRVVATSHHHIFRSAQLVRTKEREHPSLGATYDNWI